MKSNHYFIIAIAFVAFLMISNTIAAKLVAIGPFVVAGGIILFPLTYIFGDILTEVYGYRGSRPIIWAGFGACVLMALSYALVQQMPTPAFWQNQDAYVAILGQTPRIVVASLVAYLVGEFINSFVLSRMKVMMRGKFLWIRTIGSTVVGEGVDTIIFAHIAFLGIFNGAQLWTLVGSGFLLKVAIEIIMTPITYRIVSYLKRKDEVDVYDIGETYNPLKIF